MIKRVIKILIKDVIISYKFKFNLKSQQNRNNNKCFYYNKKK